MTHRLKVQPPITMPMRTAIAERLRGGEFVCDIARSAGVSEYTVRKIARQFAIQYAVCAKGTRWGKVQSGRTQARLTSQPVEQNFRAAAAALRWGNGNWGRGFW